MRSITGAIACLFVGHHCPLESLKKTGEPEDSEKRVMATCGRCGRTITAYCGLAMRTTWYRLRPLSQNAQSQRTPKAAEKGLT